MQLALPEILWLSALIVAFGLATGGKAYTDALVWIIGHTVGKIPLIGGAVGGKAQDALQKLSNSLGHLANEIGGEIARNWHVLATIVDRTGWALFHVAQAVDRVAWYVSSFPSLNQIWARAQDAYALARRAGRAATQHDHTTKVVNDAIARPGKSTFAPGARIANIPFQRATTNFQEWVRGQLAAMRAAVAEFPVAIPGTMPLPFPDISGALRRLRKRIGRIEAGLGGAVGLGALAYALGRLGLGWARCNNVGKAGRAVCHMDGDLLEDLIAGTLLVFGTISLVELAEAMQEITEETAEAVHGFIREG